MLQCGQRVLYGVHGVCQILEQETRVIDRKKVEYFVLVPQNQPGARYLVPVHNEAAVAKLRPLLSKEQLDALIVSAAANEDSWIADENQRKLHYRELINSSDRAALICMVRSLRTHKEQQLAAGRKFHLCDENFLRDAQKLLSAEFSIILGIDLENIWDYIENLQKQVPG